MGTINELNPHYCRAYFQSNGKLEKIRPMGFVKEYFQYYLKLRRNENVRDRETATAHPSGMQSMITARILTVEGIKNTKSLNIEHLPGNEQKLGENWRDFTGKRIQET